MLEVQTVKMAMDFLTSLCWETAVCGTSQEHLRPVSSGQNGILMEKKKREKCIWEALHIPRTWWRRLGCCLFCWRRAQAPVLVVGEVSLQLSWDTSSFFPVGTWTPGTPQQGAVPARTRRATGSSEAGLPARRVPTQGLRPPVETLRLLRHPLACTGWGVPPCPQLHLPPGSAEQK